MRPRPAARSRKPYRPSTRVSRTNDRSAPRPEPQRRTTGRSRACSSWQLEGTVGPNLDTVFPEPLAYQVLERGPCATRHVQQAIDLPLREQRRVRAPRSRPVRHLGQPAELRRKNGTLFDGPLQPLLSLRKVEAGLPQRVRKGAEGVRVRGRRRHRAAPGCEIGGTGRASELIAERPQLRKQVVARQEPARIEARGALRRVPGPEVLDDGLRVHPYLGILR